MNALFQNAPFAVFIACLALVLVSSIVLSNALDRVGSLLRLSAEPLGIITALGADRPEIASSIAALQAGSRDVGLGVSVGSNILNLAALFGLTAIVAGNIVTDVPVVALSGGVGIFVLATIILQLFGVIPAAVSVGLIALVFVPYVDLARLRPRKSPGCTFSRWRCVVFSLRRSRPAHTRPSSSELPGALSTREGLRSPSPPARASRGGRRSNCSRSFRRCLQLLPAASGSYPRL